MEPEKVTNTAEISNEEVHDYIVKEQEKKPLRKRLLWYVWDSFGKDPETRAFVNRLDAFLLLYSMYAYFVKYLDQSNVSNAYVSGMQEDLHMVGQDRNYMNLMFNMGYMTGSTIAVLTMTRVRPSIYLAACESIWTICTFGLAGAKNVETIYGLRFVAGLAEASAFPGLAWVIGSWYSPDELCKRMTIFEMSACIGTMCSGYLQGAVYNNLNGHAGLKGWQWLFIVDGIMSVPMCFLCYYCVPDAPSNTRARWLKPKHREFALKRSKAFGRAEPRRFTPKRLLGVILSWQFWCYGLNYMMFSFGFNAVSYMNLWLKSLGRFSVAQINDIPTAGSAWLLVSAYIYAVISDATGKRAPLLILAAVVGLVGMILLSIWDLPFGVLVFAFLLPFGADGGTSLSSTWVHECCQQDHEQRGMMIGLWNTICYGFTAWMPLYLFPTPDAPHYKFGYQVQAGFYGFSILITLTWVYMYRRDERLGKYTTNALGLPVAPEEMDGLTPRTPSSQASKEYSSGKMGEAEEVREVREL
ncbi:hypothetical protein A1O1_06085 [Capronia coronata CBS 617.96]|uniref:Major facilitator superfamily (MFS) profile domain-containing protein n=1 Tax=Capronia coronata CBS 617.96 TaxID=1182541 RepID=W9XYT0_9EURO|nr:uncharacterized protein A1O1_06085 [Capronia coronata CBS 617.96]EXJ85717.1 hypothetical protein A1O1_06085 [Capronia coronata CBS 617.96]